MNATVKARKTPYMDLPAEMSVCGRCGLIRKTKAGKTPYCRDCRDHARALGWIDRPVRGVTA